MGHTKLDQDAIDRKAVEEATKRFVAGSVPRIIKDMQDNQKDVVQAVEDMRRKSILCRNKHWLWEKVAASANEQLAS